jgi:menaquinone-dependent protoporphyrinogen oxidase
MPEKSVSRRTFLKAAGFTLGAGTLACAGIGYAASQIEPAPQSAPAKEVETPAFHYGKDANMSKNILVAYATRTGSTVGVASAIGETLAARDYRVDVKPFKDNPAVDGYQAVVLGSAINGAQWLPEAAQFVKDHQAALQNVPVALFCVHIMNLGDDEKSRAKRLAYLDPIRQVVQPADEAFFTGMGMDPKEDSAIVRWAARLFGITQEGDCRDWTKIRGWAETVFA